MDSLHQDGGKVICLSPPEASINQLVEDQFCRKTMNWMPPHILSLYRTVHQVALCVWVYRIPVITISLFSAGWIFATTTVVPWLKICQTGMRISKIWIFLMSVIYSVWYFFLSFKTQLSRGELFKIIQFLFISSCLDFCTHCFCLKVLTVFTGQFIKVLPYSLLFSLNTWIFFLKKVLYHYEMQFSSLRN